MAEPTTQTDDAREVEVLETRAASLATMGPDEAPVTIVPTDLTTAFGLALGERPPVAFEAGRTVGGGTIARYEVAGELGRGGMGAVLVGRDADLGRELAVKVLLDELRGDEGLVRRFVEEAQIAGQLQHPGVVPVYELGRFDDRRPYFTMKLVRGRTFRDLLAERPDPAHDLTRMLGIFTQVCQTVAYAHARGVIHRDLKPANIMVGGFGEVLVMDWGLAKVLKREGEAGATTTPSAPDGSGVEMAPPQTARSGSRADESRAGSVLGTPAYMAPEQARGALDEVDERSDVFGLGAILCEVLTGRPPFLGRSASEVLQKAAQGDLADALARLDACGADAELLAMARDCLAPSRDARPRDARAVASRITEFGESVRERLRQAEIEGAAARARADEEAKRRRLSLVLAATVFTLIVSVGGGTAFLLNLRQRRQNQLELALKEAEVLRDQAAADPSGGLEKWRDARGSLEHADDLLAAMFITSPARGRLDALERQIEAGERRAVADKALIERIEEVRARHDGDQEAEADADFGRAFAAAGLDLDRQGAEAVGRVLARRPKVVATAAAAALVEWAIDRRGAGRPEADWHRPIEAARRADPDPWRDELLIAYERDDLAALRRLAADPRLASQPPASLWLLGWGLHMLGDSDLALAKLREGRRRFPDDYWLCDTLGEVFMELKPSRDAEAVPHLTAAVALRPKSAAAHYNLAAALYNAGRGDESADEYVEAIRLRPDEPEAHRNLAEIRWGQGRFADAAVEYAAAARLRPGDAKAHLGLGLSLTDLGRLDEANDPLRRAVKLDPKDPFAQYHLARNASLRGDFATGLDAGARVRALAPVGSPVGNAANRLIDRIKRLQAVEPKLPAVLRGDARPASPVEGVDLARLALIRHRPRAAAKLYESAFAADPKLLEDLAAYHRHDAACAAAMTGLGRGDDAAEADPESRAALRSEALGWLRDELAAWSRRPAAETAEVVSRLRQLRLDPDLAGLRDPDALERLPEAERAAWRRFWDDVDGAARRRAGVPNPTGATGSGKNGKS
ncbi:MAG TPA: protein kinase [Isosphaeraceae bacterium]|nr:protein kinase [Isosphaeraceae bacterium]